MGLGPLQREAGPLSATSKGILAIPSRAGQAISCNLRCHHLLQHPQQGPLAADNGSSPSPAQAPPQQQPSAPQPSPRPAPHLTWGL